MTSQKNCNMTKENAPSLPHALYDFVATYTRPSIKKENIIHADQNRTSLPRDTEEYALITILHSVSHGSPVEQFDDATVSITTLYEYFVQIDFFSNEDNARKRAISLANIGRSSIAPTFFNQYGMSLTVVSDPQDATFVGDANQYIKRWLFTLQVTMPETNTLFVETSKKVEIFPQARPLIPPHETTRPLSYFEDVDVHHKA